MSATPATVAPSLVELRWPRLTAGLGLAPGTKGCALSSARRSPQHETVEKLVCSPEVADIRQTSSMYAFCTRLGAALLTRSVHTLGNSVSPLWTTLPRGPRMAERDQGTETKGLLGETGRSGPRNWPKAPNPLATMPMDF